MTLTPSFRVLSFLLMCLSLSQLPPIAVGWYYNETDLWPFFISALMTFGSGFFLWLVTHNNKTELRTRDGFLIVALFWTVLSAYGALPFCMSTQPHLPFVDAVFETVSGLTTTGATVLIGLDAMPRSILYYRSQLHFLGGMGIIVLAVAVLPMLGVGGLQLFRAETSGIFKDSKLTPRIAETAKALWIIYIALNILCTMAFWLNGMTLFDAVLYAFATISTGGFAPHDASFAYYPGAGLQLWCVLFMFLGGLNFSLHYVVFRQGNFLAFWRDAETRTFIRIQIFLVAIITLALLIKQAYSSPGKAFIDSLFQVISVSTTTGFTTTDFSLWPVFIPVLLLIGGLIGGCAGSTAGGIKTIRLLVILKQGSREIQRLIHPAGVFLMKINQKTIPDRIVDSVWGFIGVYMIVFNIILMSLMWCGLDFIEAFSSVVSAMANIGPALGEVATNFTSVSDGAKWVLSFAMLVGRLEVFSIMVLFSPAFWRQ